VAVVRTSQMVKVTVLEEWPSVNLVHKQVQARKRKETVECEIYSHGIEKVARSLEQGSRWLLSDICPCCDLRIIEEPDNRGCVDERVDFEVHCEPEQEPSKCSLLCQHRPKQCSYEYSKQSLGATSCTDSGHHWIQQPNAGKFEGSLIAHLLVLFQDTKHHPPCSDIADGEQDLSERKPELPRPYSRVDEPRQEGRITIRVPCVRGLAARDVARSIREDIIVNIGVFHR